MNDIIQEIREIEKRIIAEWGKPRTIFAFMFYFTLCYLVFKQLPVPEILKEIVSFLMGFYFGQKLPEQKDNRKEKGGV
jgi:uncharacterized membrane protein YdjX (TVP38/TMEM64 family)